VLVEYDNAQSNANHVHAGWRDLENDSGGDLLRRHYAPPLNRASRHTDNTRIKATPA
jgi:hypothetical protein